MVSIVEFAKGHCSIPAIGLVPNLKHKVFGPYENEEHAERALIAIGARKAHFGTTVAGDASEHEADYEGWVKKLDEENNRYFGIVPVFTTQCLVCYR